MSSDEAVRIPQPAAAHSTETGTIRTRRERHLRLKWKTLGFDRKTFAGSG